MITKLKYQEIDFQKYEQCLRNSCQNSDYAARKFLDEVSEKKWFLLVYKDYEAIMPVCYRRKFGFYFILMPKICQQLGVFSLSDDPEINMLFYDFLKTNFPVVIYSFNKENNFNIPLKTKVSYILQKGNYASIKKNYSVHRRRNVRILGDLQGNLKMRNTLQEDDLKFFVKNVRGTKKLKQNAEYYKLLENLLSQNLGEVRVLEFQNKPQSLVYLHEGKTTFYLSLFVNEHPLLNPNLPSIMIDYCLQEFIEDKNFDFMGSDVENVAKFNERFGAVSYKYAILKQNKTTLFKNLWKSYRIITNFASYK